MLKIIGVLVIVGITVWVISLLSGSDPDEAASNAAGATIGCAGMMFNFVLMAIGLWIAITFFKWVFA